VPVGGARVASGAATAVSGSDGGAALALGGAPGRQTVTATKRGMIDAFPITVSVK
jgi:hypothetical protein